MKNKQWLFFWFALLFTIVLYLLVSVAQKHFDFQKWDEKSSTVFTVISGFVWFFCLLGLLNVYERLPRLPEDSGYGGGSGGV